jgi:hypothetical protein
MDDFWLVLVTIFTFRQRTNVRWRANDDGLGGFATARLAATHDSWMLTYRAPVAKA